MLNVTVHTAGKITVFRCHGRIVSGDESRILRKAVLSRVDSTILVIDLARVDGIDAGGLGLLLDLRAWTRSNGIQFKLVNVTGRVQQALELTNLSRVL